MSQSSKSVPKQEYFHSVVSLRGIACLLVCFYHFCWGAAHHPHEGITRFIGQKGWIGVQIFFVISGFVIPYTLHVHKYRLRNLPRFFAKRAIRLEPSYLVALFIFILVGFMLQSSETANLSISSIFMNMFYLVPFDKESSWVISIAWTLFVELQYYLLIALTFVGLNSNNRLTRNIFFMLILLSSGLWYLIPETSLFRQTIICRWIPLFMLGNLAYYYKTGKVSQKEFWILLAVTTIGTYFHLTKLITVTGLATVGVLLLFNKKIRILGFLGGISYSIYLMHPMAIMLSTALWENSDFPNDDVFVLVMLALTILISLGLYYLVEKPTHALSRKLKLR